mmetsp:Transcript_128180/g.191014  ORF Transcript_128180/g.191014 Transcript_128180/m.191014 type:complete len:151 (-) Transcript_128180:9-461(-)
MTRGIKLVGELIKSRGQNLRIMRPDQNLEMCATLLHSNDIARAPVVSAEGELVGLVSERDIRLAISIPYFHPTFLNKIESIEKLRSLTAADVMTPNPVTVNSDASLADVIKLMLVRKLTGVPILDPETQRVEGMCSELDLLEHMLVLVSE